MVSAARIALVVVALQLVPSRAVSQTAGVEFGMSSDDLRTVLGSVSEESFENYTVATADSAVVVGGIRMKVAVELLDDQARVQELICEPAGSAMDEWIRYGNLFSLLKLRYGDPTAVNQREVYSEEALRAHTGSFAEALEGWLFSVYSTWTEGDTAVSLRIGPASSGIGNVSVSITYVDWRHSEAVLRARDKASKEMSNPADYERAQEF
jgi:hypothetical protein